MVVKLIKIANNTGSFNIYSENTLIFCFKTQISDKVKLKETIKNFLIQAKTEEEEKETNAIAISELIAIVESEVGKV